MNTQATKSKTKVYLIATIILLIVFFVIYYLGFIKEDEQKVPENVELGNLEKEDLNPSDYVKLGNYEEIEVKIAGLDVSVGGKFVGIPYRDEESATQWTLEYYYSQKNQGEDSAEWEIPTDEEVAEMGIVGVSAFYELKNYVGSKLIENDDITSFMMIGDAVMEQIVKNSTYEEIPKEVSIHCESIYTDYLERMKSRYNEIGEIPVMQEDDDAVRKVLAAMAIAQDVGFDMEEFDYEEILKIFTE